MGEVPKQLRNHTFKPGNKIGAKKAGVPEMNTILRRMALAALTEAGGKDYLAEQAKKNPQAFLSFLAKLMPKDLNINNDKDNPVHAITNITLVALEGNKPQPVEKIIEPEPVKKVENTAGFRAGDAGIVIECEELNK